MKIIHIIAICSAVIFGLIGFSQYAAGMCSLYYLIFSVILAAAAPYAIIILMRSMIVPPDYAGTSASKLLKRYKSKNNIFEDLSAEIILSLFRDHELIKCGNNFGVLQPLTTEKNESGSSGYSGFSDLRYVGLINRRIVFTAIYVKEKCIFFH
jgi:hypothetical protein